MAKIADASLCIASKDTARIQEGHILCGHMLCDWIELAFASGIKHRCKIYPVDAARVPFRQYNSNEAEASPILAPAP